MKKSPPIGEKNMKALETISRELNNLLSLSKTNGKSRYGEHPFQFLASFGGRFSSGIY